jgi:two-component system, NtrC family, nitrogen regulation sensor histidine kinase GlnL
LGSTLEFSDRFGTLAQLFQGLTHEIKNPIQGILASAEALNFQLGSDTSAHKLLEMIQQECLRIDQLLNDLLDLARPIQIESGCQPVDKILQESARNVAATTGPVTIDYKIQADLPQIQADRFALNRALTAILTNAVESGGRETSIVGSIERSEQMIRISIQDNGEGILPENLMRVREPFFSTRPKKAGLGLTIADRMVQLHGGGLEIRSERGAGTTVVLTLPIQR